LHLVGLFTHSGVYHKFFAQAPVLEHFIFYTWCACLFVCLYVRVYCVYVRMYVYEWLSAFDLLRNLWNPGCLSQPSEKATSLTL
jgi:hypothetical protein